MAGSGFMELDDAPTSDSSSDNLFSAVVAQGQTLVSGESVSLRLSEPVTLEGVTIPAGTMMAAKSSLLGERLLLHVSSIRVGNRSLRVSLEVVDQDGMAGIREQGSINRDAAKESASEAVGTLGQTTSLTPNLAGQAVSAGLQGLTSLASRKIKLVRVGLPAGYKVFLRNSKNEHN